MEPIKYEEFIEFDEFFLFIHYYSRREGSQLRNSGRFFFSCVCRELACLSEHLGSSSCGI